ncbi:MAG: glutamine--fructose-6-phosphate transaminase (isomerizing) [Spirochaetes bacterium]|nr:glutamine--fructose-6-phosphate transaminase (isomerizing) [Spirochaetota bacterium]
MCGIVGYVGKKNARRMLIEGLKRLEYRGYDSAGISTILNGNLVTAKEKGKISNLERIIPEEMDNATAGICHTRWATHGAPNAINAHPHLDMNGKISLVHNGIIENYRELKTLLGERGYTFKSETDSEVLPNLIAYYYNGSLEKAVQKALIDVEGTFGIAVISSFEPDTIVAARKGSPLIVGVGEDEMFVASDVSAVIAHTRNVIYLEDDEMVTIKHDQYKTMAISSEEIKKTIHTVDWDIEKIEKSGFDHFMLKEIFEQPITIENAYRGRLIESEGLVKLGGLNLTDEEYKNVKRILIVACGTSFYAGLVGKYLIEDIAQIPVTVEYASEFRYRNPIIEDGTLVFSISQSGETADTLAALREARRRGAKVLGITNIVGSTIARETDGGVYIHAGPEIGVASTKAFTSQIVVLSLLAIHFGRRRHVSVEQAQKLIQGLKSLPDHIRMVLSQADKVKTIADKYFKYENALYLGRGYNYPVALEGALKLKEISYIHAEGYPAAEMKHGPIALIDAEMPVVVIATSSAIQEKVISNIQEVRARKGIVIAVASTGDKRIAEYAEDVIYVPDVAEELSPIVNVIPLQLLSYYIAVRRGCEIDQPRNLAKSVTVE